VKEREQPAYRFCIVSNHPGATAERCAQTVVDSLGGNGRWWIVRDYGDGWKMAEGYVMESV